MASLRAPCRSRSLLLLHSNNLTDISFAEPTKPMLREAAEAGFYTSADDSKYPRIQLLTIKGLLEGTERLERPLHVRDVTFKSAPKHRAAPSRNLTLNLGDSE